KHGVSEEYRDSKLVSYEEYEHGQLKKGHYYNASGEIVSEVIDGKGCQTQFEGDAIYSQTEIRSGNPEGLIQIFTPDQQLTLTYTVKDGKKTGEECEYYPLKVTNGNLQPKLSLFWYEDVLQGIAKTWYENGTLESQRELDKNKKHGL